jgi:hypothetical protein
LIDKNVESPFIPKGSDNFDSRYCSFIEKPGNQTIERYHNYYKDYDFHKIWINYTYGRITEEDKNNNGERAVFKEKYKNLLKNKLDYRNSPVFINKNYSNTVLPQNKKTNRVISRQTSIKTPMVEDRNNNKFLSNTDNYSLKNELIKYKTSVYGNHTKKNTEKSKKSSNLILESLTKRLSDASPISRVKAQHYKSSSISSKATNSSSMASLNIIHKRTTSTKFIN